MSNIRMLSDRPTTEDLLDFDRYVEPLATILSNPDTETPFTVGVFGSWGSGKSTLLDLLESRLDKGKFVCVRFNPWVHRAEENMLIPLLHTLADALSDETHEGRFLESAKKIASIMANLGANLFLKHVTGGAVDLGQLEGLEKKFLETRASAQSEMRKLRKNLQDEADKIADKGAKLVFFIDDLDRCEPDEIIDLLEAVKLFLDLENIFIVLAVDKQIVDHGIQIKYHKFDLEERARSIGAEYLEKMVQLPLHLFPLDPGDVARFMTASKPPQQVADQIPLLSELVVPNPRKIKRILNLLTVRMSIAEKGYKKETRPEDDLLARMVVLQVQRNKLYEEAIEMPDALIALEQVYNGEKDLNGPAAFAIYKERAEDVRLLCKNHYRPGSFLERLFDKSPFKTAEKVRACLMTLGDVPGEH